MSEIQIIAEPGARNAQSLRIYCQFTVGEDVTQRCGRDATIVAPTLRVGRVARPEASQVKRLTVTSRLTQAVNPLL
jgi:hypothetical protein